MENSKTCTKCGQTKPITEFYFNNVRMTYKSACKGCCKARMKNYRETHKRKPRTKEQRRKEYITQCIKIGIETRFALKNLFEGPINGLKKCTKCGQHKPLSEFYKDRRNKSGHRSQCKTCIPVKRESRQRTEKRSRERLPKKEAIARIRVDTFLNTYQTGDGCCLYCGEIEPFFLNNHHIFGRKNSDFTVTLCENHHAPFTRGMPFVLKDWY